MAKLLVINGFISELEKSGSKVLGDKFMEYYLAKNPKDEVTIIDLNDIPMASKTLSRNTMNDFYNNDDSEVFINQLKNTDKVLMVTPMINFMPSPIIRNYLDHVLVANKTFSYKYVEKGKSKGLLDHLTVEIIISRGSPVDWYAFEGLRNYMTGIWQFMGAKINGVICNDGTQTSQYRENGGIEIALKKLDSEIKKQASSF